MDRFRWARSSQDARFSWKNASPESGSCARRLSYLRTNSGYINPKRVKICNVLLSGHNKIGLVLQILTRSSRE